MQRCRLDHAVLLQSLIRSALRASSPALAASLRHVLEGLHSQRLTPGTDAMLLRLYHPLLFRDLAAANASVRNNALQLLVDAFPLQDSAASAEVIHTETSSVWKLRAVNTCAIVHVVLHCE